MIVGLTGGIGSGKSTVLNIFNSLNIKVFSADQIAKDIFDNNQPILLKISNKFGTTDRAAIREKIFNNPDERKWLENLLHPLIKIEINNLSKNCKPYCIVEIPLLIEANFSDCVDRVLVVDCPEQMQIQRAMLRDNSSNNSIERIINTQASRRDRLAIADDIIDNSKDIDNLTQQVKKLHATYNVV